MKTNPPSNSVENFLLRLSSKFWTFPLIRRFAAKWIGHRDIQIASGVGAGLRFNIAGSNLGYASGKNEPPVQEAIASFLHPGDVFFDIGANIGFFSVIAAHLVGPEGQVYAFEPVPDNVALLEHNLELNGFRQAQVLRYAVSNRVGKGELLLAEWNGGATLSADSTPPDLKGALTVDLMTIDAMINQKMITPPSLAKIDVEGAELDVLEGMVKTIELYHPVIIFEIDDGNPGAYQKKLDACEALLKKHGYQIRQLQDSYPAGEWIVGNYLATPPAKI